MKDGLTLSLSKLHMLSLTPFHNAATSCSSWPLAAVIFAPFPHNNSSSWSSKPSSAGCKYVDLCCVWLCAVVWLHFPFPSELLWVLRKMDLSVLLRFLASHTQETRKVQKSNWAKKFHKTLRKKQCTSSPLCKRLTSINHARIEDSSKR